MRHLGNQISSNSSSDSAAGDSQGKTRQYAVQKRVALLLVAFIAGITFGIVIAERLYVEANREHLKPIEKGGLAGGDGHHQLRKHGSPITSAFLGSSGNIAASTSASKKQIGPRCKAVGGNCELEQYLQKIAPGKEILVAISNFKLILGESMLNLWIEQVQKAGATPWMVLAIDQDLYDHLRSRKLPVFLIRQEIAEAQQNTGSNHAVSALKFGILAEFIKLGWSVLLSDVDIVTLSNPFEHLYRDRDIEGMTDGFDDRSAYGMIDGLDDASMGWARYAQSTKHMNLNSGLFYVSANANTLALMERLADRLSRQKYWDQTAFNEEIFFLSHGDTTVIPISVRVMEYWRFMNSKVFFKTWRLKPKTERHKPVMVHINYHPNKEARMKGIIEYFSTGNDDAIMRFPGGSEPGT